MADDIVFTPLSMITNLVKCLELSTETLEILMTSELLSSGSKKELEKLISVNKGMIETVKAELL